MTTTSLNARTRGNPRRMPGRRNIGNIQTHFKIPQLRPKQRLKNNI